MTQTQPVNPPDTGNYWDNVDAWGHAAEKRRREDWAMQAEQAERDAMFTAEVSGGRTLMERVVRPCVFLIVAGLAACLVLTMTKGMGWTH